MRVKSVPRHLPRKDGTLEFLRAKTAVMNTNFVSFPKIEESIAANVKMANLKNCHDMVQEMNFDMYKQQPITHHTLEKWRPFSVDKFEAVDLSRKSDVNLAIPGSSVDNDRFKDTYLYQIMTDPNFLQKIIREKQSCKSSCPYCKQEFGSESEVKKHLNVQADDSKQLTCCACGKSFAQKRYLRYHQRCHSERNKFACDICTRKYSRLDNLTRHNIFHTNPNKFPCDSCERTFARKDLLNKHLKCHENKYKFYCDSCQKYFKGPVSLENHMKLFHSNSEGNKPSETLSKLSASLNNNNIQKK